MSPPGGPPDRHPLAGGRAPGWRLVSALGGGPAVWQWVLEEAPSVGGVGLPSPPPHFPPLPQPGLSHLCLAEVETALCDLPHLRSPASSRFLGYNQVLGVSSGCPLDTDLGGDASLWGSQCSGGPGPPCSCAQPRGPAAGSLPSSSRAVVHSCWGSAQAAGCLHENHLKAGFLGSVLLWQKCVLFYKPKW